MIKIELPDGSIKEVEAGISGFELANQISHNLAKAALAVEIDGTLKDLTTPLTTNAKVKIITAKDKHGLEILRHSCSHVMSEAVKELWPDVQVTIGPFIEDGFYYDIERTAPHRFIEVKTPAVYWAMLAGAAISFLWAATGFLLAGRFRKMAGVQGKK